ncbi:unnamed protein product [Protopolystoma xenopodis]|uniref:Uncharacterized protein n=1 Tax=Protopolystoma xenopodis TaxID=117903 RepID=A0A448XP51_9PLAT|nr:unnamed protein product [Protopolystoma xenopodis]
MKFKRQKKSGDPSLLSLPLPASQADMWTCGSASSIRGLPTGHDGAQPYRPSESPERLRPTVWTTDGFGSGPLGPDEMHLSSSQFLRSPFGRPHFLQGTVANLEADKRQTRPSSGLDVPLTPAYKSLDHAVFEPSEPKFQCPHTAQPCHAPQPSATPSPSCRSHVVMPTRSFSSPQFPVVQAAQSSLPLPFETNGQFGEAITNPRQPHQPATLRPRLGEVWTPTIGCWCHAVGHGQEGYTSQDLHPPRDLGGWSCQQFCPNSRQLEASHRPSPLPSGLVEEWRTNFWPATKQTFAQDTVVEVPKLWSGSSSDVYVEGRDSQTESRGSSRRREIENFENENEEENGDGDNADAETDTAAATAADYADDDDDDGGDEEGEWEGMEISETEDGQEMGGGVKPQDGLNSTNNKLCSSFHFKTSLLQQQKYKELQKVGAFAPNYDKRLKNMTTYGNYLNHYDYNEGQMNEYIDCRRLRRLENYDCQAHFVDR